MSLKLKALHGICTLMEGSSLHVMANIVQRIILRPALRIECILYKGAPEKKTEGMHRRRMIDLDGIAGLIIQQ